MAKKTQITARNYDPKCREVVCFTEKELFVSDAKTILVVEKPAVSFRQEFENNEDGSKESLRVFIEKSNETC